MPAPDPHIPFREMSIPELIRLRDEARLIPETSGDKLRTIEASLAARLDKLPPYRRPTPRLFERPAEERRA